MAAFVSFQGSHSLCLRALHHHQAKKYCNLKLCVIGLAFCFLFEKKNTCLPIPHLNCLLAPNQLVNMSAKFKKQ